MVKRWKSTTSLLKKQKRAASSLIKVEKLPYFKD